MAMAAHSSQLVPDSRRRFYGRLARAVAPRRYLGVTGWADAHRMLSSKASAEEGRYRSSRTPHLRAIMDCLSPDSPVQRVVVKKPAQGGVTELALNWIGQVMYERPVPMLVVVPTLELRKRWVRQRLDPMLQDTPCLAEIFDSRRRRDAGNSEDLKDFPGGQLIIGGANSPASLSSMPICYFVCDEVSRFPWEVGEEGDPLGLIDERTKNFMRRKGLLISSPTVKGQCRISQEYDNSDQGQLHMPCPHCGDFIVLKWFREKGVTSLEESRTTRKVWYICTSCGAGIEETSKETMLNEHRWVARFPERKTKGFHWSGLCAPIGLGYSWREMLDIYQDAENDSSRMRRFINTSEGEVFEEDGEMVEFAVLMARVETYPEIIPARLTLAFCDVQKDRVESSIYRFGENEEAWAIDHIILPGDTADGDVWNDLSDALDEQEVQLCGIDAGYQTQMVKAFVEKRPWCIAMKGVSGMDRPLVEDERKRRQRLRQRKAKGVPVEPIGVDSGKAMLYARLRKEPPEPGVPCPGYIHYPDSPTFDREFFEQLTAEKLVLKAKHGRPYHEWVPQRPRNEALDCAVGCIAVYHLANVYRPRSFRKRDAIQQTRPSETSAGGSILGNMGIG